MAQWLGQYTGNSHLSKVQDLEATLSHAVCVFRQAESTEICEAKGKAVRKLAEKLLTARLKLLRAQLYIAEPVKENESWKQQSQIENLRNKEVKTRAEGINGILIEFDAQDLIE